MAIRIALMALLLFGGVALAAPKPGGPVRGAMTIGESKLAVDVSWLQDGGVVLLAGWKKPFTAEAMTGQTGP